MCLKQFVKILTKSLTTLKKVCRIPSLTVEKVKSARKPLFKV